MAGRKAKWEELEIVRRYSDLSEPFFNLILEMFNSEDKNDKKWAAERIEKGYIKMIPQQVAGIGGEAIEVKVYKYADNDSLQLPTKELSAGISSESEEV